MRGARRCDFGGGHRLEARRSTRPKYACESGSVDTIGAVRLVIVNADDFGLVASVNEAVIAGYRAGTITSATLMPNGTAAEGAARAAAQEPGLGVGLHFTLTHGMPVAPAGRSLVDREGRFISRRDLLRRSLTGALRRGDIERELRAQLSRLHGLGIEPTHVDGHQHVQVIPVVASVVAAVARERGLPVRLPNAAWGAGAGLRRLPQGLALTVLCALAGSAGLRPATSMFTSIFDLRSAPIDASTYVRLLGRSIAPTIEVMVHPAFPSRELQALHPDLYEVAIAEGRALIDVGLAARLRDEETRLVSFRELP